MDTPAARSRRTCSAMCAFMPSYSEASPRNTTCPGGCKGCPAVPCLDTALAQQRGHQGGVGWGGVGWGQLLLMHARTDFNWHRARVRCAPTPVPSFLRIRSCWLALQRSSTGWSWSIAPPATAAGRPLLTSSVAAGRRGPEEAGRTITTTCTELASAHTTAGAPGPSICAANSSACST
jgi:hypothetical protein